MCLVAGCDVVWRLDDVHGGSAAGDASGDGAANCAFADDFGGQVVRQEWDKFSDDPRLTVLQNDQLFIAVPTGITGSAEAGIRLIEGKTLPRGGFIEVEIVKATTTTEAGGPVETYMAVRQNLTNGYVIDVSTTYLEFYTHVAGNATMVHTRTYDPQAHRWWRFEHGPSDDEVTFSTSADRIDWFAQKTIPIATPLVNVEIGVVVGSYNGGIPVSTSATIDNFSICD